MPGVLLNVRDPGINLNIQKWNKRDFENISIYTYIDTYSLCRAIFLG